MRFLYKIYSEYDGFTPQKIPERMLPGNRLALGWRTYADVLEPGHEVWVYFHGRRVRQPGVYAKGFVESVDPDTQQVIMRVRESSVGDPLTDAAMSARIAGVVRLRGRQVFVAPDELEPEAPCALDNCRNRRCGQCARWRRLPTVDPETYRHPHRLRGVEAYIPGYWVIPAMCFMYRGGGRIAPTIETSSRMFYDFKLGEEAYAFPLALGMYEALRHQRELQFDAIVPVPLSPDKAAAGQFHRTRALSRELARLLGVRVVEALSLRQPISKRVMRNAGATPSRFERSYAENVVVNDRLARAERVLLIDDVCTWGSTLRVCAAALRRAYPQLTVVAATAGQMIVTDVVTQVDALRP